jgi:hypothetical protein
MNIIKCLAHTKLGGERRRKPSHNTQNDNTKHLKIRRRGLRLCIQRSNKKARTNPKGRIRSVVLSESTIKRRQFLQNSIYSAEQSAIINALYSTATYNQKRVIITDSLSTIMAVSDRKRSKNPKTQFIRKIETNCYHHKFKL